MDQARLACGVQGARQLLDDPDSACRGPTRPRGPGRPARRRQIERFTAPEPDDIEDAAVAAYEFLVTDQEVWDRALDVQRELAARSTTRAVGMSDLLVAAVAERHRVVVLHYDADFDHVASITGQPAEWVVPRGSGS